MKVGKGLGSHSSFTKTEISGLESLTESRADRAKVGLSCWLPQTKHMVSVTYLFRLIIFSLHRKKLFPCPRHGVESKICIEVTLLFPLDPVNGFNASLCNSQSIFWTRGGGWVGEEWVACNLKYHLLKISLDPTNLGKIHFSANTSFILFCHCQQLNYRLEIICSKSHELKWFLLVKDRAY